MMKKTRLAATAMLLLFGAAACDLEVTNPNNPEQARALANPSDVEALIGGSWWSWYSPARNVGSISGTIGLMLSTMSFQHSSYPANFGMVNYSTIPRTPTRNATSDPDYGFTALHWTTSYRAVAAVNDGLRALNSGVSLGTRENRARAFARFVQGIGHGTIGMLYDRGPIVDETTDLLQPQTFVGYQDLLAAAIGYLDQAITLAQAGFNDPIPFDWMFMDQTITAEQFIRIVNSYKAMLTVANARTPAEADQINWQNVLNWVNAGVQQDITFRFDGGTRSHWALYYSLLAGWSQMNYMVHGMADTSGKYQEWMALPVGQRTPNLPSGPFLIMTPDQRFPQGATLAAQLADVRDHPDQRFQVHTNLGDYWGRSDRGEWRWSYYSDSRDWDYYSDIGNETPYISYVEQRLLAAEALYRLNRRAEAAAIVNETRTAAGLNATDANGTNTSCVPKLPNGQCGGLLEMIKWERRMLASHEGQYLMATMYFDSRRWGDLMEGTILNWPVPCRDALLEPGMECENYGGSLEWGAPVGTYGY
jgi:hypothetical protein